MMKKRITMFISIVSILLLIVGCTQAPEAEPVSEGMEEAMIGRETEAGYYDVTPEEAKMLIDTIPDLVVVDVSPKYDDGHLPGAINYYVGDGSLDKGIPDLDMSKPYLVYCHVDSAAIAGATKLIEAGFDPVYRLEGNYSAWVAAGYPVEVPEAIVEEPEDEGMEEVMVGRETDIGYYDVTPEEAKMLIDTIPDLVVVDVSPKYDDGHLPGAINYYVGDGSLDKGIPDLDMSKPYLVYCHVDSAAIAGATKLIEAGFDPVYRLEGNYSAWVAAGYPIEQ